MKSNLTPKEYVKYTIRTQNKERIALVLKKYWEHLKKQDDPRLLAEKIFGK